MIPLILLLLLLLTGCGTPAERQVRQTLRCAEEVLAEHPDSALTLLTPLDTMSLAGEEQAWYAVLRTQADYKLRRPITDSLPLLATAYYGTPRRPHYRAAMAWYSLGCVFTDHNDDPRAIDAYLKARDLFPDTLCRYYALTEQNLGQHYLSQHMLDAAEQVLRHYHDLSVLRGDSTDVGFSHFFLGRSYLYRLDYAQAAPYYDSVFTNPHSTSGVRARCLLDQAKLAIYHTHDYERGFQLIDRYRKAFHDDSYLQIVPGIRGDLFSAVGQNDSAYACYSLSVQHAQNLAVLCNGYNHLAELSARLGRAEESIKYFKLQCQYRDSIYYLRRTDEIAQIEQRHAIEVHELKEREEHTRLVILLSAAVLTLLLLFLFLYTRADRRRKQEQLRLMQQLRAKEVEIMELNALLPADRSRLLALYQQEAAVCRSLALSQEGVRRLAIGRSKAQSLSVQERDALLAAVRESYVTLFQKVHSDGAFLSEQDRDICALSHLQISTRDIAEMLSMAEETVRTHKHRMKQKLDSDLFQLFFEKA